MNNTINPFAACFEKITNFRDLRDLIDEKLKTKDFADRISLGTDFFSPTMEILGTHPKSREASILKFNFLEDRIVTQYKGEKISAELSVILKFIRNYSEIYDIFISKPDAIEIIKENEETLISYRPDIGCFTTIAVPSKRIDACRHFFQKEYIKAICTKLNVKASLQSLAKSVTEIYLNRCILGLVKVVDEMRFSDRKYQKEFARLKYLEQHSIGASYTEPLDLLVKTPEIIEEESIYFEEVISPVHEDTEEDVDLYATEEKV